MQTKLIVLLNYATRCIHAEFLGLLHE